MLEKARKTGEEYSKEYNSLLKQKLALESRISERLYDLCLQFPDAIIGNVGDTLIKAKTIGHKIYINGLDTESKIDKIKLIEKWIHERENYKQTKINF